MSETRATVSTGALLAASTGLMLAESFGDFHRAADVLMGQSLMTHQFASEAVCEQMAREARRQHPWLDDVDLEDFPDLRGKERDEAEKLCRAFVAELSKVHGEQHVIVSPPEPQPVPFTEGMPAKWGGSS